MKKSIAFYPTPNFIVKEMIKISGIKKNQNILETGFGECAFIEELYNQNFKNIFGVEYSNEFYSKAKNNFSKISNNLYHEDYLSFQPKFKVEHIIGNPPYINSDNLDKEVKENIRTITQSGEGNIYYAFIIKSIQILEYGGSLTYILPYDFFYNTYASKLREYMIQNGYFTDIVDFGESKVFENAAPETIIFRYIKNTSKKPPHKVKVKKIKQRYSLKEITNKWNDIFEEFEMENFKDNKLWSLSSIKKEEGTPLKDIEGVKISVGIVNGFESAFHVENLKPFNKEERVNYIKGFIKNKNRNSLKENNEIISNYENYIWIPNNKFKTEEELKTKLPNIYNHLLSFKEEMLKRKLSKTKLWFDYLAIRNKETFDENKNKLKIHVPGLTRQEEQWFFISKDDNYVGGDLLTITCEDENKLKIIFNYLNSDRFTSYYKEVGAKKGKRTVFTQKILSEIIIPKDIL